MFGKVAGVEAAKFAKSVGTGSSSSLLKQAQATEQHTTAMVRKTNGTERIADLRKEMAQSMEDGCGIFRLGDSMQATCHKIDELRERCLLYTSRCV